MSDLKVIITLHFSLITLHSESFFTLHSIKESRLLIFNSQLTVHSGKNALNLSEGEHSAEERVARIVATALVAKHRHTVVNTHWQTWVLALEDASQLYYVGTSAKMRSLGEVAVGEDLWSCINVVHCPWLLS